MTNQWTGRILVALLLVVAVAAVLVTRVSGVAPSFSHSTRPAAQAPAAPKNAPPTDRRIVSRVQSDAVLSQGPHFTVTFVDGFRVEVQSAELSVRPVFELANAHNRDTAGIYKDVYAADGRLLEPTAGFVDPLSALEVRDIDGDGISEVVGYQQIWGLFHANTIAIARTIWRWRDGGLHLVTATVQPPYSANQYAQELSRLDVRQPAAAVSGALAIFAARMGDAPPAWRGEAIMRFRAWHRQVEQAANATAQARLQAVMRQAGPGRTPGYDVLQKTAHDLSASPEFQTAGLSVVYSGEGEWVTRASSGFYAKAFGRYASQEFLDFFALEGRENEHPWAMDAGLVIPLPELGRRVAAWEAFHLRYPDSPFGQDAERYYTYQLNAFLFGLDNTPHFDRATKKALPGVVATLQSYAKSAGSTPSGRLAAKVLAAYQKSDYILTPSLSSELQRLKAQTSATWETSQEGGQEG